MTGLSYSDFFLRVNSKAGRVTLAQPLGELINVQPHSGAKLDIRLQHKIRRMLC